jgi:hypothetical protein
MSDFEVDLVTGLQASKGFDPYFSDITHARDLVDPPLRRHRRDMVQLDPGVDVDEYDVKSSIDIDRRRLVMTFGHQGLVDIAGVFTELTTDGEEGEEIEAELAFDGLRFALVFQGSQVFLNDRIRADNDFFKRIKEAMPVNKQSVAPYEREPVRFDGTSGHSAWRDSALQYRVCRLASRVALDRISTFPTSKFLRTADNTGGLIIDEMKKKLEAEALAVDGDQAVEFIQTKAVAWAELMHLAADDNYPLMWASLANPAPRGVLSGAALAHIGVRHSPRPGWKPIE